MSFTLDNIIEALKIISGVAIFFVCGMMGRFGCD